MSWKLLGKKTVLKTFRSEVQSWKMRLPNGKSKDFFITAGYDVVIVLAVDVKSRVIILEQYYINQQKKLTSLVAGIVDENEPVKETARRELVEETGYTAKKFIFLGKSIKGKYITGDIYHFLALDAVQIQEPEREEAEDIKILTIPMLKFKQLLLQHKLLDGFAEVCARRALEHIGNVKK